MYFNIKFYSMEIAEESCRQQNADVARRTPGKKYFINTVHENRSGELHKYVGLIWKSFLFPVLTNLSPSEVGLTLRPLRPIFFSPSLARFSFK